MSKIVALKTIEKVYAEEIDGIAGSLSVDAMIELSQKLYDTVKVKGISQDEDDEADMLLFQYGTYNIGKDLVKDFTFDITRQLITEDEEMYQLSLTLIFDAANFATIESYNLWSADVADLAEWVAAIKKTKGYEAVLSHPIKAYELKLDQQ